jgi:DegV family protein with EDD domain
MAIAPLKNSEELMKIAYLDGTRLYRVLYAGIQSLLDEQDYLNKINVFPVPDGDTGTNMAYTLMGVIEHIQSQSNRPLNDLSELVAEAALDHARGNSGVILAQFFHGLAEGLAAFSEVNTGQFASASKLAVDKAYTALMEPREGTILSVLRAWAEELESASELHADFALVFDAARVRAQSALEKTPDQLEVLKKAGVVDAAGQGFLNMLDGIAAFTKTGDIRRLPRIETSFSDAAAVIGNMELGDLNYPYCTECILVGQEISREDLNKLLIPLGDSIVIAGSKNRVKIHIHTDDPKQLFTILENFGEVHQQKVDDMRDQHASVQSERKIALVVDSTCDLPPEVLEQHHIHVVPVRLAFGSKHYIDRVTITSDEFYGLLQSSRHHPTTSQPPPADFRRMYQFLSSHYESVISLHLPQVLSGTLQNANTAMEKINFKGETALIDSLSVSAGTGMIVMEAAEAIESGADFNEVLLAVQQSIHKTKIFIGLESLDAIRRGGRLGSGKKRLIDFLRLNLILSINEEGYLKPNGVTWGRKNILEKFERFVFKKIRNQTIKRIGIVHGMNLPRATLYEKHFKQQYPDADIFISEICPALGVHGGAGVVGVAVQFT